MEALKILGSSLSNTADPDHQVEKLQGAKQQAAGWQTTACAMSPPRGPVTRQMQTAG